MTYKFNKLPRKTLVYILEAMGIATLAWVLIRVFITG